MKHNKDTYVEWPVYLNLDLGTPGCRSGIILVTCKEHGSTLEVLWRKFKRTGTQRRILEIGKRYLKAFHCLYSLSLFVSKSSKVPLQFLVGLFTVPFLSKFPTKHFLSSFIQAPSFLLSCQFLLPFSSFPSYLNIICYCWESSWRKLILERTEGKDLGRNGEKPRSILERTWKNLIWTRKHIRGKCDKILG